MPYSYRWKALYGEVKYPSGGLRGIDISHYQKEINWQMLQNGKIQDSPLTFVFIKATEGKDEFDEFFNFNFKNARKYNITRGAYHFFTTQSSGYDQAKFFCEKVKLQEGDLPPVLDIEIDMDALYDKDQTKQEILNWLSVVENQYQVKPIIYASYRFKQRYLSDPVFNQYPYWIAHYYVDSLEYDGSWAFWQHTDVGRVDGINGYVDIDMFNGTMDKLKQLTVQGKNK